MAFVLILMFIGGGTLAITMIIVASKMQQSDGKANRRSKTKSIFPLAAYSKLYRMLDSFFLTRTGYNRILDRCSNMAIYNSKEIMVVGTDLYLTSISIPIIIIVASIFMFKDAYSTLLVSMLAVMMKETVINKQIDKAHLDLLKQLEKTIMSIRQQYLKEKVIPEAIRTCSKGQLTERALDEIYLILTANNGKELLANFCSTTPFACLQSLANISYKLNDLGDTTLQDGTYNFIAAMDRLAEEVRADMNNIMEAKAVFGKLEYLPVIPIFAVAGVEGFFIKNIPGTSVIYRGFIGYISRTAIAMAGVIGYQQISSVNRSGGVSKDDRSVLAMTMLKYKWFTKIVDNVSPKAYKKIVYKKKKFEGALSSNNLRTFYASKIVYSFIAFVFTFTCFKLSVDLGKSYVYNNVNEISLVAPTKEPTKKEIKIKTDMDKYYLNRVPMMNKKETEAFVRNKLPEIKYDYDRQQQIDRLQKKYKLYHSFAFKYWMIIVAYIIGILGWYYPDYKLRFRKKILKIASEEDVLQQQTMIAILMNTPIDTLECLYWMSKQSKVFKRALIECYHEYTSDPLRALNRLKDTTNILEFRNMIDRLIVTIHQISLLDAFGDLLSERAHLLKVRERNQKVALQKKRRACSPAALIPLALLVILIVILPIFLLGYQTFTESLKNIKK